MIGLNMQPKRYLIVNADDFGQSPGVNRGVVEAHEHGIVTSASLMVRWRAAGEAAAYAREHPRLSLGLHVDLGEWIFRDETWVPLYQVVTTDDAAAVADQVSRQLASFRQLDGRDPTHIDSHQHIHRSEPARSIMLQVAAELGVPLRDSSAHVRYEGGFYGQTGRGEPLPDAISEDGLCRILRALPPGITELSCHPGLGEDLDTMYHSERVQEVRVLCAPRVRDVLSAEGIELVSFQDVMSSAIVSSWR